MRVIGIVAVLMLVAGAVYAAPSYLGPSGNILTPDELTVPQGNFSIGYHVIFDIGFSGTERDLNVFHGHYGLTPNIEVGIAVVDPSDDGSDVAVNGKWRFYDETATRPAFVVGVMDVAGNALDDDPTFYVLITKSLTRFASDVMDEQSKPLRGTLGIGTGFYDGIFLGLDWTLSPQLSVMAEYVNGGDILDNNNMVNAGVRYAVGTNLRLDLATIDFDELAVGVSYTTRF